MGVSTGDAQKEIGMKNLITCLTVCVLSAVVAAEIHHVPADFLTIQSAVDAALGGDEIIVAPGTYTSTADEVVNMRGKEIWLHSSEGAEVTIIDGEETRRGILCENGETSNTIIEGFTITNGYNSFGGGMYNNNSSPTLENCTFTDNTAANLGKGGGMYNSGSDPTLTNCTFTSNTADEYGGGMYNLGSSPTLTDCTFTNNTADDGGGMSNDYNSNPILTNCTFTNNSVSQAGGGMHNDDDSSPTLIGCTFTDNSADQFGGGMRNLESSIPALTDTTVCGNTPADQINGTWTDNGGNTIAETCPWNTGACCTNDGCVISEQEDCITFLGQWLGEGTTCAGNACPNPCAEDVNGDGMVDVNDILLLIGAWGVCP
jgi:parallel beta-helix repeat protein